MNQSKPFGEPNTRYLGISARSKGQAPIHTSHLLEHILRAALSDKQRTRITVVFAYGNKFQTLRLAMREQRQRLFSLINAACFLQPRMWPHNGIWRGIRSASTLILTTLDTSASPTGCCTLTGRSCPASLSTTDLVSEWTSGAS